MFTFEAVKSGINSARMIMVRYIINVVKHSSDNLVTFSDKAYSIVSSNDTGSIKTVKPVKLFMYDDNGSISESHCVLQMDDSTEVYVHEMSADDLFSICEMLHEITDDVFPEDDYAVKEVVDLAEDEFEVLAF